LRRILDVAYQSFVKQAYRFLRKEHSVDTKDVSSFFTGFFVGALVGGAAALLFAPQSGEETRAQIRDKGIELKEKAEETYGEVIDQIEDSTTELRGRLEGLSAKMDELIAQGKEEFQRLTHRAEEIGDEAAEAVEPEEDDFSTALPASPPEGFGV
jgi:gas vesicle protein